MHYVLALLSDKNEIEIIFGNLFKVLIAIVKLKFVKIKLKILRQCYKT